MFQDLGSSPANMQAGKAVDCYASLPGNACEQSDGEQAYVQADLGGVETWAALPEEAWPKGWYHVDGKPKHHKPVVRILKALYGHPDSGTYWEKALRQEFERSRLCTIRGLALLLFPRRVETFLVGLCGRLQDERAQSGFSTGMGIITKRNTGRSSIAGKPLFWAACMNFPKTNLCAQLAITWKITFAPWLKHIGKFA